MKLYRALIVCVVFFSISQAQAQNKSSNDASPCRMMSIHCVCENPHKDFVIPKQKVGKTNPTDPGACWSSKDIDNLLNNLPMTYCSKEVEYQKDFTKPQTKCTATWSCIQPCDLKEIGPHN